MKLNFQNRTVRLALILVIPIFFIIAFATFYISESDKGIRNVQVTNLTSNSATIVWETDDETAGEILISDEDRWKFLEPVASNKDTFYDDRNLVETADGNLEYSSELKKDRTIHHVTIRNLESETQYYFRIKGVLKAHKPVDVSTFTTLPTQETIVAPETMYGKIKSHDIDTENPTDGIVLWKILNDDSEIISNKYSTVITAESSWSGDLNSVFNTNGEKVPNINTNQISLEAIVPGSSGIAQFTLDEYKPLGDLFVNVLYLPEIE